MSRERLLSALDDSERNSTNARMKNIREDLNKLKRRFLWSKINEIRRNLYKIENEIENEENRKKSYRIRKKSLQRY